MRSLTSFELSAVSGGKSKPTPASSKKKPLPSQSNHGQETAAAASNKVKKPKA